MIERDMIVEKLEKDAHKFVSNMTESAIVIKTLRAFQIVISLEGFVM